VKLSSQNKFGAIQSKVAKKKSQMVFYFKAEPRAPDLKNRVLVPADQLTTATSAIK